MQPVVEPVVRAGRCLVDRVVVLGLRRRPVRRQTQRLHGVQVHIVFARLALVRQPLMQRMRTIRWLYSASRASSSAFSASFQRWISSLCGSGLLELLRGLRLDSRGLLGVPAQLLLRLVPAVHGRAAAQLPLPARPLVLRRASKFGRRLSGIRAASRRFSRRRYASAYRPDSSSSCSRTSSMTASRRRRSSRAVLRQPCLEPFNLRHSVHPRGASRNTGICSRATNQPHAR